MVSPRAVKRIDRLDPDSWSLLGLLVVGLAAVGWATAAEAAFASVNRGQVRELAAAGRLRAAAAESLLGQPARLLAALLVTRLGGDAAVIAAAMLLSIRLGGIRWLAWTVVAAVSLLLLAHTWPRTWVLRRPLSAVLGLTPLARLLAWALMPLTVPLQRLLLGAAVTPNASEMLFLGDEGLRLLLNTSGQETVIEEDEKEMIASIFAFSDKLVREVMVPRIDVAAVPVDAPMTEALEVILKNGHSRIPVYKGSIDNIVGILYAKDLLRYLRDGRTDIPLDRILRAAYFIPESKKVDELLQELQQRRVHMAVVVDEYGGTAGIVTIEDLLEEIVGEIQDEYDAEQPTVEVVSEHEYLFDARISLDDVSKHLGVELPEEGGDTLGGFIYSQLGRVPAVSDRVEFRNAVFEVLSVAGRRIKQVRATLRPDEMAGEETGEATGERFNSAAGDRADDAGGWQAGLVRA